MELSGKVAKVPGKAVKVPGKAVKVPGKAVKVPGKAVKVPGKAVKVPDGCVLPKVNNRGRQRMGATARLRAAVQMIHAFDAFLKRHELENQFLTEFETEWYADAEKFRSNYGFYPEGRVCLYGQLAEVVEYGFIPLE